MDALINVLSQWAVHGWFWWSLLMFAALLLIFVNAPGLVWFVLHAVLLAGFVWLATDVSWWAKALTCLVYAGPLVVFGIGAVRRSLVCRPMLLWYRDILPPISGADRAAMAAGTVGWDGEFFRGRPRWKRLLSVPSPSLSERERRFMAGPVEALCAALNGAHGELPDAMIEHLRRQGFLALQVPEDYGGHGLTDCAVAATVSKVAGTNLAAAMVIFYANAGSAVHFLMRYGTDSQRQHYLPRMATGEEVGCYASGEAQAGNDAGAFASRATVTAAPGVPGNGTATGMHLQLDFDKPLVALAPIATFALVVLRLKDPDRLLETHRTRWTGMVLLPLTAPGIEMAKRCCAPVPGLPVGRLSGSGLTVEADALLGGKAQAGNVSQWLAGARIIARSTGVPALASATAKLASRACGAYARIRFRAGSPLGYLGGIQELLGRMAADTFCIDAARRAALSALEGGGAPSVLAGLVKYNCAARIQRVALSARLIQGSAATCEGWPDLCDTVVRLADVAPAMDASNVLARSHLVFGQGILRSHPFLSDEINAAINPDTAEGLRQFDRLFTRHLSSVLSNALRTVLLTVAGARLATVPRQSGRTRRWFRALSRMSAAFALTSDLLLSTVRGDLARHQRINGRMADILSQLYLGTATLKHFRDTGRELADEALVERVLRECLYIIQENFIAVLDNFPTAWLGSVLRVSIFPFGRPYHLPSDALDANVAQHLLVPSAARERLTGGLYRSGESTDTLHRLETALTRVIDTQPLQRKMRHALKIKLIAGDTMGEWINSAEANHVLTAEEARLLREAETARAAVMGFS